MSTITKEKAKDLRNAFECWQQDYDPVEDKEQHDMFGLGVVAMDALLASLEAEPVAWLLSGGGAKNNVSFDSGNAYADPLREVTPLYTAPPAPVSVPDEMEMDDDFDSAFEHGKAVGWNACRAAMLQGADGNSPVITDDVRRMDWLVSKTVDVREPMVYGSHSLFWSQTITDEEDDYHATKLREQIDAAMAAEQAAAPQQEVK